MAYSHKLHNPTPFPASIEWDRGVNINVPADGSIDLTTKQMEQFMPGEPGSEEIRKYLDSYGVFLENSDRDYDAQALQALRGCHHSKNERYTEAVARLADMHTMQGLEADPAAPAFRQKLASMGLAKLKADIEVLEKRIELFSQVVEEEDDIVTRIRPLDPKRTVFVMDPPREFSSVTQMEIFLSEHPDIEEAHTADVAERAGGEDVRTNDYE